MRLRSGHELEQRDYLPDRSSAIMLGLVAPRVLPVVEDLAAGDVPAEGRPLEDDIGERGRLGDRREMASRSRRRQLRGPAGQHRKVRTALGLPLGLRRPGSRRDLLYHASLPPQNATPFGGTAHISSSFAPISGDIK